MISQSVRQAQTCEKPDKSMTQKQDAGDKCLYSNTNIVTKNHVTADKQKQPVSRKEYYFVRIQQIQH